MTNVTKFSKYNNNNFMDFMRPNNDQFHPINQSQREYSSKIRIKEKKSIVIKRIMDLNAITY
ncbi:hypothetical protein DERP_012833 [Dermatophagoides pteronyssinus]|uniref:Uncharacterized protein n=1 Tax=Dermatophagoides pteronyssinus TaxID=6956 RepID=A0ABQ8JFS3_DERPT|nr:hypothetical protein DERP_012833 [Dermatophagoides pteronyssinus]